MDLVRFGVVIRALRRRRAWRQLDLAAAASVSQDVISMVERGFGGRMALDTLIRIAAPLEARLVIELRWRAGELDRLMDHDHAELTAAVSRVLIGLGWEVQLEVTYAVYGANGSIDLFAWHAPTRTLLVIEIKTEVTSGEATLRKLDEKARLAQRIASERFGWMATTVARLLVIEGTSTARARVARSRSQFDAALPFRGVAVRRWLRSPSGSISGLMFVQLTNQQRHMSKQGGRHRVRRPARGPETVAASVEEHRGSPAAGGRACRVLPNRT